MYDNNEYLNNEYRRLLNKLNQIKSEMDTTNSVFKEIYGLCKNTVRIDNKCMENELFSEIKGKGSSNISSITNTISIIRNKL